MYVHNPLEIESQRDDDDADDAGSTPHLQKMDCSHIFTTTMRERQTKRHREGKRMRDNMSVCPSVDVCLCFEHDNCIRISHIYRGSDSQIDTCTHSSLSSPYDTILICIHSSMFHRWHQSM